MDISEPFGFCGRDDLAGRRRRGGPKPPGAQLREARQQLDGAPREPPDGYVRHREHPSRAQNPASLGEEPAPGPEVECRLHADDAVHAVVGKWDPDGVSDDRVCSGLCQRRPSLSQLGLRDVQRDESTGPGDLGDDRILDSQTGADIEDDPSFRDVPGECLDQSTHGDRRLLLGAAPLPQPQVQPAWSQGKEEISPQALVDGRGRVPPLPEKAEDVAEILPGPAGRAQPSGQMNTGGGGVGCCSTGMRRMSMPWTSRK